MTVRYWAGAKAAAQVAEEKVSAGTLAEALDAIVKDRDKRFAQVLSMCSIVVREQPVASVSPDQVVLSDGDLIEVLPPFAGGSDSASPATPSVDLSLPGWRSPVLSGLLGLLLMVGVAVGPGLLWPVVVLGQLLLVATWHRSVDAPDPIVGLAVAGGLIAIADVAVAVADGPASYGPIAVVVSVGFLAAVGQQLARRDDRTDLTLSLSATIALAAMGALGAGWVVNLRLVDGDSFTLVAACAVTAAAVGRLAPRAAGAVLGPLAAGTGIGAFVATASSTISVPLGAGIGLAVSVPAALAAVASVRLPARVIGWPSGAAWPVLVAAPLAYFVIRVAGH